MPSRRAASCGRPARFAFPPARSAPMPPPSSTRSTGAGPGSTTRRPFRFHRFGTLNTHTLSNGLHVLGVRVVYRNHTVRQFSTLLLVRNLVAGLHIPVKAPNPVASATAVGVHEPARGRGSPGPARLTSRAHQYNYAPSRSSARVPLNSRYQVVGAAVDQRPVRGRDARCQPWAARSTCTCTRGSTSRHRPNRSERVHVLPG